MNDDLDFGGLDNIEVTPNKPTEQPIDEVIESIDESVAKECPICKRINVYMHCEKCNRHHAPETICSSEIRDNEKEQKEKAVLQDTASASNSVLTAGIVIEHTSRINHYIDEIISDKAPSEALPLIEAHIEFFSRKMELARLEQMEWHKRRNKVLSIQTSEDVERIRLSNPSRIVTVNSFLSLSIPC